MICLITPRPAQRSRGSAAPGSSASTCSSLARNPACVVIRTAGSQGPCSAWLISVDGDDERVGVFVAMMRISVATGQQVDTEFTEQLALGLRQRSVARAGDEIDLRDVSVTTASAAMACTPRAADVSRFRRVHWPRPSSRTPPDGRRAAMMFSTPATVAVATVMWPRHPAGSGPPGTEAPERSRPDAALARKDTGWGFDSKSARSPACARPKVAKHCRCTVRMSSARGRVDLVAIRRSRPVRGEIRPETPSSKRFRILSNSDVTAFADVGDDLA